MKTLACLLLVCGLAAADDKKEPTILKPGDFQPSKTLVAKPIIFKFEAKAKPVTTDTPGFSIVKDECWFQVSEYGMIDKHHAWIVGRQSVTLNKALAAGSRTLTRDWYPEFVFRSRTPFDNSITTGSKIPLNGVYRVIGTRSLGPPRAGHQSVKHLVIEEVKD